MKTIKKLSTPYVSTVIEIYNSHISRIEKNVHERERENVYR